VRSTLYTSTYTADVHTTGGGKGYTVHDPACLSTAGGVDVDGYSLHVKLSILLVLERHPERLLYTANGRKRHTPHVHTLYW